MRRREFLGLAAAAMASRPVIALAQASTKRPLIAVLSAASQATSQRWIGGFPQGSQELGYVAGRDYEIEYRYGDGDHTRLPLLAEELVRHKPNVIVTGSATATLAAKRAAGDIPIVFADHRQNRLKLNRGFGEQVGNLRHRNFSVTRNVEIL